MGSQGSRHPPPPLFPHETPNHECKRLSNLSERAAAFPKERGKDYNHSTFCDLVISGLVGFIPNGAEGCVIDPLFPDNWDYLVLENLRYHGHDVDVRWQRGKGLTVVVDGREAARQKALDRLSVPFRKR